MGQVLTTPCYKNELVEAILSMEHHLEDLILLDADMVVRGAEDDCNAEGFNHGQFLAMVRVTDGYFVML